MRAAAHIASSFAFATACGSARIPHSVTRYHLPMPHWDSRPEPRWRDFHYKQPYAKGLGRVRELLADPARDFDPATFWQWGTMQAMALITVLKDCEARFGEAGQQLVHEALRKTGLDVGRQILADISLPADLTEAEFASFYATVINRIAYAWLEDARIDDGGRFSCSGCH